MHRPVINAEGIGSRETSLIQEESLIRAIEEHRIPR